MFISALVERESAFIDKMRVICDDIVVPLNDVLIKKYSQKVMVQKLYSALNLLPVLLDIHQTTRNSIKGLHDHKLTAERLWQCCEHFRKYCPYGTAYANCDEIVAYLMTNKKKPEFSEAVEYCLASTKSSLGENNDLMDILLIPFRHLPQYVVFLLEIVKQCESGTEIYENFKLAVINYAQMMETIFATVRTARVYSKLTAISEKFETDPNIYHPRRSFLGQGMLFTQAADGEYELFFCLLLSDRMVVIGNDGKHYWMAGQIPINKHTSVETKKVTDLLHFGFSLSVHGSTTGASEFAASSESEQKLWLEQIQECIKAFQPVVDSAYPRPPSISISRPSFMLPSETVGDPSDGKRSPSGRFRSMSPRMRPGSDTIRQRAMRQSSMPAIYQSSKLGFRESIRNSFGRKSFQPPRESFQPPRESFQQSRESFQQSRESFQQSGSNVRLSSQSTEWGKRLSRKPTTQSRKESRGSRILPRSCSMTDFLLSLEGDHAPE
eukprot:150000_1